MTVEDVPHSARHASETEPKPHPEKENDADEDDVALSYLQLKSSHLPEGEGDSKIIEYAIPQHFKGDVAGTDVSFYHSIVHVACFRPEVQMFSREHLLSDKLNGIGTRELVFQVGINELLIGEMVQEYVEEQAKCLLRGLLARRASTSPLIQNKKPTIIFVAYDLGSVIVKTVR
ncbi:hypothetical protein GCG54_00013065 [Colletotrichum gloeosporioides]|uniref:Uncharacterized protein n=1 Tax=Colletotrichum gloeosporioides TaxID=474922 RepID=A0A8H4CR88_COLGL|nr:uncharacterized protein GCG54_00013065 [Colletotrichum gloeosporioides]KAF3808426.1 hypothetical protein GCG54_00013065 [Colletotrichum gloeosporioides]